jgi:uncharacterized membrane protein
MAIENPILWGWDRVKLTVQSIGSARRDEYWPQEALREGAPVVRRIGLDDIRNALAEGFDDFGANRTDVIFLCVFYPVVGFVLGRLASGYGVVPLLFPLISGFALVGPLAAVGLNEMSRRREQGLSVAWSDAFDVLRSPSIGSIAVLGMLLIVTFLLWLIAAQAIYEVTLGPQPPVSVGSFIHDVFATRAGWTMIVVGVGVGFLFAVFAFSVSVVSFPLLLERDVGVDKAVRVSISAVAANPGPMAVWGLVIVAALVIGSIPLFLGLVVVLPVLGHATWHLYRKVVAP